MPSLNQKGAGTKRKAAQRSAGGGSASDTSSVSSSPATKDKSKQRSSDSASSNTPTVATLADPHGHGPDKKWVQNERVLCRYKNEPTFYYEAKVVGVKQLPGGEQGYSIHYPGWSSRHDEVVPHSDAIMRFKVYTDEAAAKAKEDIKRAQQASSAKKRKLDVKRSALDSSADGSRGSTPGGAELSGKRKPTGRRLASEALTLKKSVDMPQVTLPDTLRRILIDDENLVNKQFMLPKLPSRVTVHDIVQKYRESVTGGGEGAVSPREFYIEYSDSVNVFLNPTSENLERSALGLMDYFETAIGSILLYKFERPMYADLLEQLEKQKAEELENESEAEQKVSELESSSKSVDISGVQEAKRICHSKQFGLPHLLRMFVRFTDMLAYTEWNERALEAIIRHAQDFVMFLSKNHEHYYDVEQDYVLAPAEYHKRVWGNSA